MPTIEAISQYKVGIHARQGDRLAINFTYRDSDGELVDLTGYTIRMQARRTITSDTFLDLDNGAKGGITNPSTGKISVVVPADDMAALTTKAGVWDLELVPAADEAQAFTLVAGTWTMDLEVTR